MSQEESLLGFHLRVHPARLNEWPAERRATYLLREDVLRPLSVDPQAWPSCKDNRLLAALFSNFDPAVDIPPNGMELYFLMPETCLEMPSRAAIVALTAFVNVASELKSLHKIDEPRFGLAPLREKGWKRLGYDVADRWLYSGLMNCGFSPSKKARLRARFASTLNEYGLFVSGEDAEEFRADCDKRVPEHAPFFVYGLWSEAA